MRRMRLILLVILLTLVSVSTSYAVCGGSGLNRTAASASRTDVNDCVTAATTGATITVPAGTATWSSAISIPITKDLSIIGAGIGSTNITCSSGECFTISNNDGGNSASRISGFTFNNGFIGLFLIGSTKVPRIDHNRFVFSSWNRWDIAGLTAHPHVLIDNNEFVEASIGVFGTLSMLNENNNQHNIWFSDPQFGGTGAVYIESNTFYTSAFNITDANYAGRYVFRFNNIIASGTAYGNEFHGVQGLNRGGQRWEIYNNIFNNTTWTTSFIRGGSGYYFNNTLAGTNTPPILKVERSCETKDPFGQCDGTWNIDGNTGGQQGWPCRDQIGRSRDNSQSSGTTGPWQAQALTPAYSWNNIRSGAQYGFASYNGCTREGTLHNLENRDWYNYSSATGSPQTVGVRVGVIANRPATCTTGVGYWATDEGEWNSNNPGTDGRLYKCTATDTWTLLYTPYTYPHPLASGTPGPPLPPNAPTSLNAIDIPSDQGGNISLSWTVSTSSGVTEQRIYRSTTSGTSYSLINTIMNNTTANYTDTGRTNGTPYYYVIRSYHGGDALESANSNESSATAIDNIAPSAPTGLSAADVASDQGGVIRLNWTVSTSGDVTQQRIYRGTQSGGPYGTLVTTIMNNTTATYDNTGLTNGVTYYYVVRAYDGTQESANSTQSSAVPVDNIAPNAPTSLNASDTPADSGGSITLTWTVSNSGDVTQQRIYRSTSSGSGYGLIETIMNNSTNSYVNNTGLTNGVPYYYVIRSYDGTQESANSNESSATPQDNGSPPPQSPCADCRGFGAGKAGGLSGGFQ